MPTRRIIQLTQTQYDQFSETLRVHPKAYLRERAAAILKIASGTAPYAVATAGLLFPRAPDTVYRWLDRYDAEGLDGLRIKPGRGRKPAFSPSAPDHGPRPRGRPARRPS